MLRPAILLVGTAMLAACNVHSKNPADGDENVTINASENGQVSFNLPFASGQVKLPEGTFHNGDFEIDGVKMYPGGTISGFNVDAADKAAMVNIHFKAPAAPGAVRAYFVDQFKAKGVEATTSGDSVSGKTKDGEPFTITVRAAGQGSEGTIAVQDND